MPLGDGTGPQGQGPMTGRAAGYCAGYGVPGYANPGPRGGGRGYGRGWGGGGRGFWGRRAAGVAPVASAVPPVPLSPDPPSVPVGNTAAPSEGLAEELSALRRQTSNLVSTLDGLLGRIEAIEARQNQKAE